MAEPAGKRSRPDRRRAPRGGRRAGDVPGLTPLVVVVDPDPVRRKLSLEILSKMRFAVAPVSSLSEALAVVPTLTPEVIVTCRSEAPRLVAAFAGGNAVPIVTTEDGQHASDTLIELVRRAIREKLSG